MQQSINTFYSRDFLMWLTTQFLRQLILLSARLAVTVGKWQRLQTTCWQSSQVIDVQLGDILQRLSSWGSGEKKDRCIIQFMRWYDSCYHCRAAKTFIVVCNSAWGIKGCNCCLLDVERSVFVIQPSLCGKFEKLCQWAMLEAEAYLCNIAS